MTNFVMASHAGDPRADVMRTRGIDCRCQLGMAFPAGHLCYLVISSSDPKGIWITAGGEIERVPEPISRFRRVLANESWRSVTVVAHSDSAMACPRPGIEMVAHDVAVGARFRIVG